MRTTRHQHTGKRAIAIKQLGPWQLVDFFLAQRDFLFSRMTALVSFHPPSVTGVAIQEAPFAPYFFSNRVVVSCRHLVDCIPLASLGSQVGESRKQSEMVASHTHTLVESSSCACVCGCHAGPVVDVYWGFSAAQRTQHAMLKGERTLQGHASEPTNGQLTENGISMTCRFVPSTCLLKILVFLLAFPMLMLLRERDMHMIVLDLMNINMSPPIKPIHFNPHGLEITNRNACSFVQEWPGLFRLI